MNLRRWYSFIRRYAKWLKQATKLDVREQIYTKESELTACHATSEMQKNWVRDGSIPRPPVLRRTELTIGPHNLIQLCHLSHSFITYIFPFLFFQKNSSSLFFKSMKTIKCFELIFQVDEHFCELDF